VDGSYFVNHIVVFRRTIISKKLPSLDALDELPFANYDYSKVKI